MLNCNSIISLTLAFLIESLVYLLSYTNYEIHESCRGIDTRVWGYTWDILSFNIRVAIRLRDNLTRESIMSAFLELWNQHGFKISVQFWLNPNKLIDPQVNMIASNFSLCESAILRMRGSDNNTIVHRYTQSQRVRNRLVREG